MHCRLDVLVDNAGSFRTGLLVSETLGQWYETLAVNQTGVFLGMRRLNSIHPGLLETGMNPDFPALADDERRRRTERHTPLGRIGVPEGIAGVALFLASDLSGYCTGQEFVVDGGIHG